jgi:hypothetical protein
LTVRLEREVIQPRAGRRGEAEEKPLRAAGVPNDGRLPRSYARFWHKAADEAVARDMSGAQGKVAKARARTNFR